MFCLEGMVWDLPGDCCSTNEKHTVYHPLMFIPWVTGKATNRIYLESFNCNLLAYFDFPSQELHSLCSEDLQHASGSSRSVPSVLQLIHPSVVSPRTLQMTHHQFSECVINIRKQFSTCWTGLFELVWYVLTHTTSFVYQFCIFLSPFNIKLLIAF